MAMTITPPKKLTLAAVNKRLEELGVQERLFRAKDYYFFGEGNAHMWPSSSVVGVGPIGGTAIEMWLQEYESLSGITLPLKPIKTAEESIVMTANIALKPQMFPQLLSTLTERRSADFVSLLETFEKSLTSGAIANPIYQEAKSALGRMVNDGYKTLVSAKFVYAGQWETLPEVVWDLDSSFMIMGLHDCKSALKKVRASKGVGPAFDAIKSFLEEVEPLVLANEALKPLVVKRVAKTEEQKLAEGVYVATEGSTEATVRVRQMLVEVTTSERENIVKWLARQYTMMANRFFAIGDGANPITAKDQRELYGDPEYRMVVNVCINTHPKDRKELYVMGPPDVAAKALHDIAEKEAKSIQETFVFKNLVKLAAIIEAKGNFSHGEVLDHSVNLSGLTGTMRFHFHDGSNFRIENSVVHSTSVHGKAFLRFPLTFHDVYFSNGERMKSPSEERMHEVFVKRSEKPLIRSVSKSRGEPGNTGHITAIEKLDIPPSWLDSLKAVKGEVRQSNDSKGFGNYTADVWSAFLADIKENGIRDDILVIVDPDKGALISEGNHRLAAAKQLGLGLVPVEIRYFGEAEKEREMFADRIERETGQLREMAATTLADVAVLDPAHKDVLTAAWSRNDAYPVFKLGDKTALLNLLIEAQAKAEEQGVKSELEAALRDAWSKPVIVLERGGNVHLLTDKLQVAAAIQAGIATIPALVGSPVVSPSLDARTAAERNEESQPSL